MDANFRLKLRTGTSRTILHLAPGGAYCVHEKKYQNEWSYGTHKIVYKS